MLIRYFYCRSLNSMPSVKRSTVSDIGGNPFSLSLSLHPSLPPFSNDYILWKGIVKFKPGSSYLTFYTRCHVNSFF